MNAPEDTARKKYFTPPDRAELEQEVLKRLQEDRPAQIEMLQDALKLKTTAQLEDMLERMKKEGR